MLWLPRRSLLPIPDLLWLPRQFARWHPCCCGVEYECAYGLCSHSIDGNMVVDLGVGGWVERGLPSYCPPDEEIWCEGFAGEFSLEPYGDNCQWSFNHLCPVQPVPEGWHLFLEIEKNFVTGKWYWWARVNYARDPYAYWQNHAEFRSDEFDGNDCYEDALVAGKIPLNKTEEYCSYYPPPGYPSRCVCDGALPATIYAWAET